MTAEQFRAQFTTSQEAADERKESRDKYFGSNVSVTEGTKKQTNVKASPAPHPVQPAPSRLNYQRAGVPVKAGPTGPDLSKHSPGFPPGSFAMSESIEGKVAWTSFVDSQGRWFAVARKDWLDESLNHFTLTYSFDAEANKPMDPTASKVTAVAKKRRGRGS